MVCANTTGCTHTCTRINNAILYPIATNGAYELHMQTKLSETVIFEEQLSGIRRR